MISNKCSSDVVLLIWTDGRTLSYIHPVVGKHFVLDCNMEPCVPNDHSSSQIEKRSDKVEGSSGTRSVPSAPRSSSVAIHPEPYDDYDKLMTSRYNLVASGSVFADYDSLNDVVIDDVTETEPTSAMLYFCKRRFLIPFVNLLGLVGLRPMTVDCSATSAWIGHVQTLVVVTLIFIGYVLQFMMGFRRDRGVDTAPSILMIQNGTESPMVDNIYYSYPETIYQTEYVPVRYYRPVVLLGENICVYVVPSILHFCGFATALYAFRVVDNEHLQNLVERVFLLSYRPFRLMCLLWIYVAGGIVWLLLMTLCIVLQELEKRGDSVHLKWIAETNQTTKDSVKMILLIAIFMHDLVQIVIIVTFAVQCHLLRSYLNNLKDKLLQNTIEPLDWMREMCEFRKLLHHLNKRIATPICWLTLLNLVYTLSGIIYSFRMFGNWAEAPARLLSLNVGNIFLWLVLGLFPFFQAASLTLACQRAQTCGHQIRIRPFVHHNTSADDLNSVLLYSSSLRMSAKLFRMPILGNYLFFVILCLIVAVLTLGMCLNLSLGMA